MNISEWIAFARENWKKEEGQTMAEYGVVLAVITSALSSPSACSSGGITKSIGKVTALLP